jgi:plasmid stabilization system protein ParE
MNRAEWTKAAQIDLARIDDYYRELSPAFADRLGDSAIAAARFLAEHRYAGPSFGSDTARKWALSNSPYVLIYRAQPFGVQILRVVHGATDWYGRF